MQTNFENNSTASSIESDTDKNRKRLKRRNKDSEIKANVSRYCPDESSIVTFVIQSDLELKF